ncbi:APC family permease [Skermania sp. ID1734]|nr:APC family permease [Skermania sp. ID1734]
MVLEPVKRLLIGRALRNEAEHSQLLPKWIALPVFCSDPISSVAYATEQILLVAGLGGAAYLSLASPVAVAVAVLLAIVVLSYRQTCHAYPSGGGAFVVSQDNLGETAALTAAAALLVDYVMTVAVSVVAGVLAITSKFPSLQPDAAELSVAIVAILTVVNLRGLKESGKAFAFPTYAFIVLVFALLGTALYQGIFGGGLRPASGATEHLTAVEPVGGYFTVLLALRAFASGCTALTGVEAISNGVPAFRKPKARNAAATLMIMGALAIVMFAGITVLAERMHARAYPDGFPSVISQLGAGVWGPHSVLFLLFQLATAAILILAANTAFNGFPVLASILAKHNYLPRQLHNRGDRLVHSNGIVLLAGFAIALIIGFNANIDKLIQLYIVGVFTSFTLSQAGMVRHWQRLLRAPETTGPQRLRFRRAQVINFVGAVVTGVVLLVVIRYKFLGGAYLAMIAMVFLFVLMKSIRRHYSKVRAELHVDDDIHLLQPSNNHAIVLVSHFHLPTMRALGYAKATRPARLTALTVNIDDADTRALLHEWERHDLDIPLTVIESPYREITRPILDYVNRIRRQSPRDVVTVFIPEYVVGHWWEQLLHNQSALRLKTRLLFQPGVMVTSVPYQLRSLPADPAPTDPALSR